jgi:hypothetical protein
MDALWYERKDYRDRLVTFGRAIQGVSPYEIVIEPNPQKCRSAQCNFTVEKITVNPTFFPGTPEAQYIITKALLVHEAAHRRFSTPVSTPTLVREVANILEDERVDRLMCHKFAGACWFLCKLSEVFLEGTSTIDEKSDSPGEVVGYFLQLRWANRIGKRVKGGLSSHNLTLWEKIKPIVYESWQARNTKAVNVNAARIVDVLGFDGLMAYYKANIEHNNPNEEVK